MRVGDEPKVVLTASSLKVALDKQAKDLRDKQLLTFKDDDVTRVDIKPTDGPPVSLIRKDKEAWTLEPGDQPTDITEVRSYLSSLRSTRAVDFPQTDAAAAGLDKPRLTVTVELGKDPAQTLLVGNETTQGTQKQVYAKRGDQPDIVTLGDWSFRTLGKDAWQFRDKTVLGFGADRGRSDRPRAEGRPRRDARPRRAGRLDGRGRRSNRRPATIQRFVDDLRELRGSSIAEEPAKDLKRFGLDAPDLRLTLSDREQKPMGDRPAREARRQVLRDARGRPDRLRGARLHVHAARQAAARLRRDGDGHQHPPGSSRSRRHARRRGRRSGRRG